MGGCLQSNACQVGTAIALNNPFSIVLGGTAALFIGNAIDDHQIRQTLQNLDTYTGIAFLEKSPGKKMLLFRTTVVWNESKRERQLDSSSLYYAIPREDWINKGDVITRSAEDALWRICRNAITNTEGRRYCGSIGRSDGNGVGVTTSAPYPTLIDWLIDLPETSRDHYVEQLLPLKTVRIQGLSAGAINVIDGGWGEVGESSPGDEAAEKAIEDILKKTIEDALSGKAIDPNEIAEAINNALAKLIQDRTITLHQACNALKNMQARIQDDKESQRQAALRGTLKNDDGTPITEAQYLAYQTLMDTLGQALFVPATKICALAKTLGR